MTFKLENIIILCCKNCKNISIADKFGIKIEKLDLRSNKLSNIDIFENFNLKELKELNLNDNNIWDIKVLEKVKFEKLEKLDLGKNKISNINIMENVNLKELKELDLNNNNISDIKVLEKEKFEKLEILYVPIKYQI